MTRRRSYSEPSLDAVGKRRQIGGARREATARISLQGDGVVTYGWTLNRSRGGIRVVLEDAVKLGGECTITVGPEGDDDSVVHQARVVWLQDEEDGQIAGIEFLDCEGSLPDSEESL